MPIGFGFILGFFVTFAVTPIVIKFAKKYKLVDNPQKRYHPAHTHKGIIPRAGGLALYLGLIIAILFLLPFNKFTFGLIISGGLLVFIGLLDDKGDINPYTRLATNFLAAIIIVGAGTGIPYITNPLTGGIIHLDNLRISFNFFGSHSILVWADLLALIWLMWTINIIGWSAGVDGQMPGFVSISAITLGLLSLRFSLNDPSQSTVTILAFIAAGIFAGFLPWNFYPQKIMPGYGGKTLAGLLLGVLGILSYGKLGTAILVLGIPMIDALYILIRRFTTRTKVVKADRGHLHHHLLNLGWGRRRIALFYWVVSAILGVVALTVTSQQKLFMFILVAVGLGGFLLWVNFFTQLSKPQDPDNG